MSTLLPAAVALLGGLDALVSLYSLYQGFRYRSYVRQWLRSAEDGPLERRDPWPKVLLVVPCCGDERGLESNLEALLTQDYPALHVRFVVEDVADGAVAAIERLLAQYPGRGELVVAGPARGRSQKVQNLLAALGTGPDRDVVAFADSDGRPEPTWLKALVAPLGVSSVGVSSSYRIYLPDPPSVPSVLRSVWNGSILTLLGDHDRNFAWGGAMAMRQEVFDRVGVREAWKNALSDDYALTHAVRRAGLRVEFVPGALVASSGPVGFVELLSWIARQIAITRVYWPGLFRLAAATQTLHAGFLVLVPFAASGPLLGLLALVLGLGFFSSALRSSAVSKLAPQCHDVSSRWLFVGVLLSPLTSFLTVQGVLRALASRRITWRGKTYEMRSPVETIVVAEQV